MVTPKTLGLKGNTWDVIGQQQKEKASFYTDLTTFLDCIGLILAEVDVNRTHQGRGTPPIGFEDRAPHQRTNYLQNKLWGFYVYSLFSSIIIYQ